MPQSSAQIGLPGDRENQIKLEAKHSDMCRFNPADSVDRKNYELVEGNILDLCEKALQLGEKSRSSIGRLPRTSADTVDDTISSSASSAAGTSNIRGSASQDSEYEDLERRLYDLRGVVKQ